jgi:hypothetical protein
MSPKHRKYRLPLIFILSGACLVVWSFISYQQTVISAGNRPASVTVQPTPTAPPQREPWHYQPSEEKAYKP